MKKIRSAPETGLILSMLIFGTIGIFRKYIDLPSGFIAFARGLVGSIFLVLLLALRKQKRKTIKKKKLLPLFISGIFLGFNWILLFEAYRYTSVAAATLAYYMAPVIIIFAAAFLFREKLTLQKVLCSAAALIGMALVSGIFDAGFSGSRELIGIGFGLAAAVLYASVVLMNKKLGDIPAYEKTILQLASAAVVILPYSLLTENISAASFDLGQIGMLILVGILHTGIAYALYFGSLEKVSAQNAAILSYIDPISAVLLSAFFLGEAMGTMQIIGAVLVLGASILIDNPIKKRK
ncbi:MAG: DMT family transporter [Christensenellaceae bacterium]|nr:DMT family transporter [Christensenellaceae bacterium]